MSFVHRGLTAAAFTWSSLALNCAAAEEVVVTAARIEQPVSEVIGAVTVITRADIERRMVQSTQDLLRGETGIDVVNSGGLGKLSNLFVRGADAEQVLVLIDGVRAGSATSGTTAFQFLPVDQIERIEIVRGPRSSLYGSDAIGGVIHIFTRRAQGLSATFGTGSNETYDTSASFGASSDAGWFSLSANRISSDGFNACNGRPFTPGGGGGGCFTLEPDRDSYDNTSGSMRAGYQWGERADLEGSVLYAEGTTEFDGSFGNETDFAQRVLSLRGSIQPASGWDLALMVGESRDDQENFSDLPDDAARLPSGHFDTRRRNASLQSDLELGGAQHLSIGVDYLEDEVDSSVPYDVSSRDNTGVFGQYQAQLEQHQLLLSARHDDNEQFGSYNTGGAGWKWTLSRDLSLSASWARAFGAPSFNDLYFPGFANPLLDPETSSSYEVGLAGLAGRVHWSLTAFSSRIDDLIVFDAALSLPNNLSEARIRGLEADAALTLGDWSFDLGYSGLDPRNRAPGAAHDNFLPRRARHSGHLEVGRTAGNWGARVRLTAQGSRYDDVANSTRLGSYSVVDVMIDYALGTQWSLHGKVGNLLDRDYQTVNFFNQDQRTFFVTVRYQPGSGR